MRKEEDRTGCPANSYEMSYSRREEYDSEIKGYVKEILLLCSKYNIPVFMTFAVADTGKGTEYVTEMLSSTSEGVSLRDDHLVKHAMVTAGFEVTPKKESPVLEEEMEVL